MENMIALTKRLLRELFEGQANGGLTEYADDDILFVGPMKYQWADGVSELSRLLSIDFGTDKSASSLFVNRMDCREIAHGDDISVAFASAHVIIKTDNSHKPLSFEARATAVWKLDKAPTIIHLHVSAEPCSLGNFEKLLSFSFDEKTALSNKTNQNICLKVPEGSQEIKFNTASGVRVVDVDDILYISSSDKYCIIRLKTREEIIVRSPIGRITQTLGQRFFRVHRSYAVNLTYIAELKGSRVILKDRTELPVSREHTEEIREAIRQKRYE